MFEKCMSQLKHITYTGRRQENIFPHESQFISCVSAAVQNELFYAHATSMLFATLKIKFDGRHNVWS